MSIAIHLSEFWKGYWYAVACFTVVNVGWHGYKRWRKPRV